MKRISLSLFFAIFALALPAMASDYTSQGGSLSVNGSTLSSPLSPLVQPAGGGSIVLQTGNLTSGDFQNGAMFDNSGTLTLTVGGTVVFSGPVINCVWQKTHYANGQNAYVLNNCQLGSDGSVGALYVVTVKLPVPNEVFSGSIQIQQINLHLN